MRILYKQARTRATKKARREVTEVEVRSVADLANLKLTDAEIARLAKDMDEILTHMDALNELDPPRWSRWRKCSIKVKRPPRCDRTSPFRRSA